MRICKIFGISAAVVVLGLLPATEAAGADAVTRLLSTYTTEDTGVTPGDGYGKAVAANGDFVMVGTPGDDVKGVQDAGSVQFFRRDAPWLMEAKITAPLPGPNAQFGKAVALYQNTMAASAQTTNNRSVYLYTYNGLKWQFATQLLASDVTGVDATVLNFGASIALYQDTLAVSAPATISGSGRVIIYGRTGNAWTQRAVLRSGNSFADGFGTSLSLQGGTLMVGAPLDTPFSNPSEGSVYVFRLNAENIWESAQVLTANGGQTSDRFGSSISINSTMVLIGAPGIDVGQSREVGGGYVFSLEGGVWQYRAQLTPPITTAEFSGMGTTAALLGTKAMLGRNGTVFQPWTGRTPLVWGYAMGTNPSIWNFVEALLSPPVTTTRRVRMKAGPLAIGGRGLIVSLQTETAEALDMLDNQVINSTLGSTNWSPTVVMPVNQTGATGLGTAVLLADNLALVGAPMDNEPSGQSSGAVHVLKSAVPAGPWEFDRKVTVPHSPGHFGIALAMDGNTLAVGSDQGVFLFDRLGINLTLRAKVLATGISDGDQFGHAVALKGNTLVVGAPGFQNNMGGAFVFVRSTTGLWEQKAMLTDTNRGVGERLGAAVALVRDMAIVGAGNSGFSLTQGHLVRVYKGSANGWVPTTPLKPAQDAMLFGSSLSADGDSLLVGGMVPHGSGSIGFAAAFGYEYKAGRWTGGKAVITTQGTALNQVTLSGDKAVINHLDIYHASLGSTAELFVRKNGLWKSYDKWPGIAATILGDLLLYGDTRVNPGVAEAGSASFYMVTPELAVYDNILSTTVPMELGESMTPLNLGRVLLGIPTKRTFTLRNNGLTLLTGLGVRAGTLSGAVMTLSPLADTALAPGASLTVTVTLVPNTGGPVVATLLIDSNDPDERPAILKMEAISSLTPELPAILTQPVESIALNDAAGTSSLSMIVDATGSEPISYQWKKDGKAIPGARKAEFAKAKAGILDVGVYTVEVSSPYGRTTSQPVYVSYNLPPRPVLNLVVNEGGGFTLEAPAQGPAAATWFLMTSSSGPDELRDDGEHIFGSHAKRLALRRAKLADAGDYIVQLGASLVTVAQVTVRPLPRTDESSRPAGGVFQWRVAGQVTGGPFFIADATARYSATGLPPGVVVNPLTGVLSGAPEAAGFFRARFRAISAAGAAPEMEIAIHVTPLDARLTGTHRGLVDRERGLNQDLGGSLVITVSASGALTGSVTLGTQTHRFAGRLTGPSNPEDGDLFSRIRIPLKDNAALLIDFSDYPHIEGTVSRVQDELLSSAAFTTERQATPGTVVNNPAGRYNAALTVDSVAGSPMPPLSPGFLQITASRESMTWSGRLADGSVFTGSSPVLPTDHVVCALPLHHVLYNATGSLLGWVEVSPGTLVSGDVSWTKDPDLHRTDTTVWPDGFGYTLLNVFGGLYTPPPPGQRMLGTSTLLCEFAQDALNQVKLEELTTAFTVSTANVATRSTLVQPNGPATLKLNAADGSFTGTFERVEMNPYTAKEIRRTIPYQGVLAPSLHMGLGFFLVPPLPVPKNTVPQGEQATLSGQVTVSP